MSFEVAADATGEVLARARAMQKIFSDFYNEVSRSIELHGDQSDLPTIMPFFDYTWKSVEEAQDRVAIRGALEGTLSWADIFAEEVAEALEETEDMTKLRTELVQAGAMCAMMLWSIDREEEVARDRRS